MTIRRETKEEITGSVSSADLRDLLEWGLKQCADAQLIEKIEPFSDGIYVTFANGQRFQVDVNQPGTNTQSGRRAEALLAIKKIVDKVELPS